MVQPQASDMAAIEAVGRQATEHPCLGIAPFLFGNGTSEPLSLAVLLRVDPHVADGDVLSDLVGQPGYRGSEDGPSGMHILNKHATEFAGDSLRAGTITQPDEDRSANALHTDVRNDHTGEPSAIHHLDGHPGDDPLV